jgi:hypothetical protein
MSAIVGIFEILRKILKKEMTLQPLKLLWKQNQSLIKRTFQTQTNAIMAGFIRVFKAFLALLKF